MFTYTMPELLRSSGAWVLVGNHTQVCPICFATFGWERDLGGNACYMCMRIVHYATCTRREQYNCRLCNECAGYE